MRRLLMGLAAACSMACFGDVTGSSTVNGAYTLRTINGEALPFTIAGSGADRTEIVDDVITLYRGGTFAQSGHSRVTVGGQVSNETSTATGIYLLLGTSVTLRANGGAPDVVAMVDGNTMTIVESGRTSAYTK